MNKDDRDRLMKIETKLDNVLVMQGELNKKLFGNGQPGLFNEFNQFKGAVKLFGFFIGGGSFIAILLAIFL